MGNTAALQSTPASHDQAVLAQAFRRRTIAVISHPDAGKSTLTEALLLHSHAIATAGAVHGKANRKATVSDWMTMEQERGISISSAALQFEHRGVVINLVDTPGHSDFSEDTYRVLSAVDAAIMLVDAAKGLETQTMKLFEVCRRRGIPVITMINKWDRPGRESLDLMDEIVQKTGLLPTPVTWPVGISGEFAGLLECETGDLLQFDRKPGGATVASATRYTGDAAREAGGEAWHHANEEVELLHAEGQVHDPAAFLEGITTPVLFGAAVANIGVLQLLDLIVDCAPPAEARADTAGARRAVDSPFSGFVFKVQSGMNPAHRDRLAFIRVCSGVFERGMNLIHEPTGRPFATKYAQQVFGRDRETVDTAWPGDIIGLINATALRPGDTLFADGPVEFPRMPRFVPEFFQMATSADSSKHKQFRRGIEQLDQEGVVQVYLSERRGDQAPVLAAVGPMQFEVATDRMANDFNASMRLETLPYTEVRGTDEATAAALATERSAEVMTRSDGVLVALFSNEWRMRALIREHPDWVLTEL